MLPLENITISRLLRRTVQKLPHRPALEYNGQVWSYEEFDREIDTFSRRLLTLGVRKGERVAVLCEAEPNTIFSLYAIMRIGAVATMLNTSLQKAELERILLCTNVNWLLIGDGYKDIDYRYICAGLARNLPYMREILYIGRDGKSMGFRPLEAVLPATLTALKNAEDAVSPQDTAAIIFTSGTTSLPKAVLGSQYSRANSGIQQANDLAATSADRFCVAMPTFHCFCFSVNIVAAAAVGACLYLPLSRHTADLIDAIENGNCTILSCVPALYHAMLNRPDFAQHNYQTLRTGFIGGSMYPPELFCTIEKAFGKQFTLLSSIGQTEATAGITTASLTDSLEVRSKTIGHFMDHVEGRISEPLTGEKLPVGKVGEICVRGYVVMQGYYKNPDATAKAIDAEGWLHTGDTGFIDENGNITLSGRLKDLIIRGGENISPAEIENTIMNNSELVDILEECKAVGVPDDHYGEEICVCVVEKQGKKFNENDIRDCVAKSLADFKIPRYIISVDELPRTLTGKIRTEELKEIARKKLGL